MMKGRLGGRPSTLGAPGFMGANTFRDLDVHVWIGYDPRETVGFVVSDASVRRHTTGLHARVDRLALAPLQSGGVYTRKMHAVDGQRYDTLSDAPISTDHAIARFFVPLLCGYEGWAVFMDGDVLVRRDLSELLALKDSTKAVQVVQHLPFNDSVTGDAVKKGGEIQSSYPRKNWSSVMLMNCGHSAWQAMDVERLNTSKGRYLHGFEWMLAGEVGRLPNEWNCLVGLQWMMPSDPAIIHYTLGTPDVVAKTNTRQADVLPFADEWWAMARSANYDLPEDPVNRPVAT